jgi:hypothetical protein
MSADRVDIQGTTASQGGQIGAELATTGTLGTGWAGTSFATGYAKTAGTASNITTTLAAVSGSPYQLVVTMTGRTAGTCTVTYGGLTTGGLTASGSLPQTLTTSTAAMLVSADAAFDGTVIISVKRITASTMATFALKNSSGTVVYEQRAGASNTNIFQGVGAGRFNTTGNNNVFQGFQAGYSNIIGNNNIFTGNQSGEKNTTGVRNFFQGTYAGFANSTGNRNSYQGYGAGIYLTTGSNNICFGSNSGEYIASGLSNITLMNNSILIGYDTRTLADNETNALVIGYQGRGLGSNTSVIGNSSTTRAKIWGSFENQSSGTTTGTSLLIQNTTPVELLKVLDNGKTSFAATNTAAGTTGAQTINKASGTVNFAAAATSLVVTNSLCTTSSIVFAMVRTNDATAWVENVVPAAGSFTINLGAAATAETSVGFFIIN